MYLAYIDESGTTSFKDSENLYVLTALIIHESDWFYIDKSVSDLKQKHVPLHNPRSFELHAKDIFNSKGAYADFDLPHKLALLEDAIDLICNMDCCIISVVADKKQLQPNSSEKNDFFTWVLKNLFEKIHAYLRSKNKDKESKEMCLMLFDTVGKEFDEKVREKLRPVFRKGTYYVKNKFCIEEPFFLNSANAHLGQLVDCVAYSIRRKHRQTANKQNDEFYNNLYVKLKSKIPKGNYGIKKIP